MEGRPTLPMHIREGSKPGHSLTNASTYRKARAGTEPSQLNGWHEPRTCPAKGLLVSREEWKSRQVGTMGQALF
jgi:hypothetical protein